MVLLGLAAVAPLVLWAYSAAVAYVVLCGYLIYWAVRSVDIAARQAAEFLRMRRYRRIDWSSRLAGLTDPYQRLDDLSARGRLDRSEREEFDALLDWVHAGSGVPAPADLWHLVVIPVANESPQILRQSLQAMLATGYDPERLAVCVSFEARCADWTDERIDQVVAGYRDRFGLFLSTRHPDGLPGEGKVKGANISWAAQQARAALHERGIEDRQVVVSAFDCDTHASADYFSVLTWSYLTDPDRDVNAYQPILLFHNNVWEVPTPSRLIGYLASMWTMYDSTRPGRTRIFASHALGMEALVSVGFWAKNIVPDDSRQYWRLYFASTGRAVVRPLHTPVMLDAVHGRSYSASLVEQYLQIRRWSYGIIDFPYIMGKNLSTPGISIPTKIIQTYRQLSAFHQWAITPLLLITARWIVDRLELQAAIDGSALAHLSGLLYDYTPVVGLASMVVGMLVAVALLPRRPAGRSPLIYLKMAAEWALLPVVVPIFLSLPAVDVHLRLAARRYLGFRVTVKNRPGTQEKDSSPAV